MLVAEAIVHAFLRPSGLHSVKLWRASVRCMLYGQALRLKPLAMPVQEPVRYSPVPHLKEGQVLRLEVLVYDPTRRLGAYQCHACCWCRRCA